MRKQKRTGRQNTGNAGQPEVTAGTDTGPEIAEISNEGKTFENAGQLDRFISKVFTPIARKLGVDIIPNYSIGRALQYNVTQGVIEYNPVGIINNTREYLTAGMREELIHAAMHKVLINQNKGKTKVAAWVDFMTKLGKVYVAMEKSNVSPGLGSCGLLLRSPFERLCHIINGDTYMCILCQVLYADREIDGLS